MKLAGFWSGLDWDNWLYNLVKGVLSGGAGSANSALAAAMVDSTHFGLGSPDSWKLIRASWLLGALMFTFAFMSKAGLPDKKQREESREEVNPLPRGGTVTVKTTDKSIVPIDEPLPGAPPKGDS